MTQPSTHRSFRWVQIILLIVLFKMTAMGQDPNFHIYIAFGQSNMEGQGLISPSDKTVDSRFQVMEALNCSNLNRTQGDWYTAVPPLVRCYTGLSPLDNFGKTMVSKLPSQIKVGVVVVAVAGCRIELFGKDSHISYVADAPSWMQNALRDYGNDPYGRLFELAKKAQQDGVIKGILMHQGESNIGDSQWPTKVKNVYEDLLSQLGLSADQVPLIVGEVVDAEHNGVYAGVNSMVKNLPNLIPTAHVVSSQGVSDTSDNTHFNAAGYRELGKRYADTMLQLLDTQGLLPTIPAHRDSIFNGTFDSTDIAWILNVWEGSASGRVVEGEYRLELASLGTENHQIQLIQTGIILEQGKNYRVRFDAYSKALRPLEVNVEKDTDPWTSYLEAKQNVDLTTTKQTFSFVFTMKESTDSSGRISFNAGASVQTVFLDNVSIEETTDNPTSISSDFISSSEIRTHLLRERSLLTIQYQGLQGNRATLNIYNLNGSLAASYAMPVHGHSVQPFSVDLSAKPKGLYILQIHVDGASVYQSKFLLD